MQDLVNKLFEDKLISTEKKIELLNSWIIAIDEYILSGGPVWADVVKKATANKKTIKTVLLLLQEQLKENEK